MNNSVLQLAGVGALHTASLWWVLFWVCMVVFAIVAVALAYALWHPREPRRAEVNPDPGEETSVWRFLIGAVGAVTLTLLGLLTFNFFTARKVLATGVPADPSALPIQVRGHQWWWEIHYPDAEPGNLIITANEIHIPVGRTVRLDLDSRDVIHSLWVPSLGGKKDLVPGMPASTWWQAIAPGIYRGECAEFCGLQHAHMDLLVVADSPADFAAWQSAQRQPAVAPQTPGQKAGRAVFLRQTCVLCHRIQGEPAQAVIGPDLTHFGSRQILAAALPNTRENLRQWILDPARTKPGVLMPPSPVSGEELEALLDYLSSLR